jgi:hypothetical protein
MSAVPPAAEAGTTSGNIVAAVGSRTAGTWMFLLSGESMA